MGEALAVSIPFAFGAAVSPLVLLAQLATLTGPRPLLRGAALLAGTALPLLVVGGLVLALGDAIELHGSPRTEAWIDVGLGAALLGLALRTILHPRPPRERKPHADPRPLRSFELGAVVMLANFSTLVLFVPAIKEISAADVSVAAKGAASALVLAIALSLAWAPLALAAAAPRRSQRLLGALGAWMKGHNRAIGIALLVGFGCFLLVRGLIRL